MRQRRETVEHSFGTIKARMGATHFLMKTLPRVTTEIGPLTVLRPGSLGHARRWQRKYGAECKSKP